MEKVGCRIEDVNNVIIWGNHSASQYPDTFHGTIGGNPIREVVKDDAYLEGPYITKVAKRGAEIISVMKKSSAASAANAACDHVHDWWCGTQPGKWCSMAVISDKNTYGAPEGVMFSFPVTCENGSWKIVEGLDINEFSRSKFEKTGKELVDERKMALGI